MWFKIVWLLSNVLRSSLASDSAGDFELSNKISKKPKFKLIRLNKCRINPQVNAISRFNKQDINDAVSHFEYTK